jgi:hypothetical protein
VEGTVVTLSHTKLQHVRLLGGLAFALATLVALAVRIGLNDGGWPLFVPAVGATGVVIWPSRPTVILAIVATAAILILGLMTVGILYGFALAPLILAFAAFRPDADQATA